MGTRHLRWSCIFCGLEVVARGGMSDPVDPDLLVSVTVIPETLKNLDRPDLLGMLGDVHLVMQRNNDLPEFFFS